MRVEIEIADDFLDRYESMGDAVALLDEVVDAIANGAAKQPYDWGVDGVFWSGVPGDEIQRLDDMSDYGRTEPIFDSDMEAALFVARNGFPWLLYEQNPEVEDGHWFVTAHRTREAAEADLAASARTDTLLFIFDGRTERPIPKPDGNGFLPPKPTERTA